MVFVLSNTNKKLMPTNEYRARKLLKSGKATIYKYRPFTIKLTEREDGYTQLVEYCCDTGYQHIGISIKSHRHEYVNEERILLKNEAERHNDCKTESFLCFFRKIQQRRPDWLLLPCTVQPFWHRVFQMLFLKKRLFQQLFHF